MRLLKKDHFALYEGRPARFNDDFLKPFMIRFFERMKEAERSAVFFVRSFPEGDQLSWQAADGEGVVHAFHCPDEPGRVIHGWKHTAAFYSLTLKRLKEWTRDHMGNMPCLLEAPRLPGTLWHKNLQVQQAPRETLALDSKVRFNTPELAPAQIGNLLHAVILNHTSGNTHREGDRRKWEALSVYSGGKAGAMGGRLRPYPEATAGVPLLLHWDRRRALFRYRFRADAAIEAPTEIYAPPEWLGPAPLITVSGRLTWEYREEERRRLIYHEGFEGEVEISAAPGG
jgi:hypothetical protein